MNKGDVILVPFPFTDLYGNKNRPAITLFDSGDDVTVFFYNNKIEVAIRI